MSREISSTGFDSRDENIQPSRERLLAAAAELFAAHGIDRVNSNQIARAGGVGVGTFYKHFGDKYSLRSELVVRGVEGLQRHLARRLRGIDPSAGIEAEVEAHAAALVEFAAAEPALFRVAFGDTGARGGAGRPAVGYSTRATARRLAELSAAGQLAPGLDPELAARAAGAMQTGLVSWWLEDPRRAHPDQIVETLVRLHPAVSCGANG